MKRRTLLRLAALLPAAALGGCTRSAQEDAALRFAPGEADRLTIYTSHPEKIRVPFIREFEDRTGIWVDTVYGGTQEMLNRIGQEAADPQGDVMFGGGVESLSTSESCFTAYKSPERSAITRREFSSPDGLWTGFSALPLVFLYNTKLLAAEAAPRTWAELADAAWFGQIAFCSPAVSGSCYTAVSTAMQLYGEGWLTGFVRNLNGRVLSQSNQIAGQVAEGASMIGVTVESNAMQAIADGSDLAYLYPTDGTSVVPDGVAVLAGAKHPENAEKFIDFVLGAEAQTYLMEGPGRRPVRDGLPELISPPLSQIPTMDYDVALAAESRVEWLALWQQLFGTESAASAGSGSSAGAGTEADV